MADKRRQNAEFEDEILCRRTYKRTAPQVFAGSAGQPQLQKLSSTLAALSEMLSPQKHWLYAVINHCKELQIHLN
jgi:hypothetical protein